MAAKQLTLTVYVCAMSDPTLIDPEDVANDILGAYNEWLRVNEAPYQVAAEAIEARWES